MLESRQCGGSADGGNRSSAGVYAELGDVLKFADFVLDPRTGELCCKGDKTYRAIGMGPLDGVYRNRTRVQVSLKASHAGRELAVSLSRRQD